MLKLLLLGLLVWVLVSILHKKLKNQANDNPPSTQSAKPTEQVVPCQHCGLHIPRSSAISYQQQYFCSQQHVDSHEVAQP